jgi:hypothetical protein
LAVLEPVSLLLRAFEWEHAKPIGARVVIRRVALVVMLLALAWIGGSAVVDGLRSDEAKIRSKLEAACEGFGDARMNPILEFLAREFVDETSGFHREDIRAAIASAFFSEKDPKTKGFPYRATVVPDSLAIELGKPAAESAEVRFSIRITDTRGGGDRVAWEFGLEGVMKKGGDGWQLVRASHQSASGSWKLR